MIVVITLTNREILQCKQWTEYSPKQRNSNGSITGWRRQLLILKIYLNLSKTNIAHTYTFLINIAFHKNIENVYAHKTILT